MARRSCTSRWPSARFASRHRRSGAAAVTSQLRRLRQQIAGIGPLGAWRARSAEAAARRRCSSRRQSYHAVSRRRQVRTAATRDGRREESQGGDPSDAVLVDIARVSVRNYRATTGSAPPQDRYVAWVMRPAAGARCRWSIWVRRGDRRADQKIPGRAAPGGPGNGQVGEAGGIDFTAASEKSLEQSFRGVSLGALAPHRRSVAALDRRGQILDHQSRFEPLGDPAGRHCG